MTDRDSPSTGVRRTSIAVGSLSLSIVVAVVIFQVRWNPASSPMDLDSGVFAYGAVRVLHGALPYRDFWDHKPPLVFYLNAAAMILFGEGPWAIWWLEVIGLAAVGVLLFLVLTREAGVVPSLFASTVTLATLHHPGVYQGGNFTETHALLPQVLILLVASCFGRSGRERWIPLAGFLTALAFLTKQTTIGIGTAFALLTMARAVQHGGWRLALRRAVLFAVGAFSPLLLVLAYWGIHRAIPELLQAVWQYNLIYAAGLSLRSLYGALRGLSLNQPLAALTVLSLGGAFVYLRRLLPAGRTRAASVRDPSEAAGDLAGGGLVAATGFLALPLEVALLSVSGRAYGHYNITAVPSLAVGAAFFLSGIWRRRGEWLEHRFWIAGTLGLVAATLIPWSFETYANVLPKPYHWRALAENLPSEGFAKSEEVAYAQDHSSRRDPVLYWGEAYGSYFLSSREAPTRYFYGTPLLTSGYDNQRRWEEFLDDLRRRPPELIFFRTDEQSYPYFGNTPQEICPQCPGAMVEGLIQFRRFVMERYVQVATLERWTVYRFAP